MDPADVKIRIAQSLEETRAQYHQLLAELSEDDWHKPSMNPAWTVGEVMFHIITALRFLPADVSLIRKNRRVPRLPAFLFHRFNEWYARRGARKTDRGHIGALYDREHRRVLVLLEEIGPDEWNKGMNYPGWDPQLSGFVTLEQLFLYPCAHFQTHAREIRQVLHASEKMAA